MMIILPHRRDGMANLERGLAKTSLADVFKAAKTPSRAFNIKLPKFKLDERIDLKRILHSVRCRPPPRASLVLNNSNILFGIFVYKSLILTNIFYCFPSLSYISHIDAY